jgi:hypothetical protein
MTQRRNGEPRATLRVEYNLTANELANALATNIAFYEVFEDLPEIMSRSAVEKNIKDALRNRGENASHEDAERDEEIHAWSWKQIDHHFFPVTRN